ncbi:sensor histidine kinase [Sphaerisporangium perillae]|uniref:sensor histidine kinase n=1 Tax=Sphaerisporangium perillae TaxID=2935860 RepID=UPI00200C7227|nr:HAMP domain-containing sensor histidine kinase [Sphaerisporangium perillae]
MSITRRITLFTGVVTGLLSALLAVAIMIAIYRFVVGYVTEEIAAAGGRVAVEIERGPITSPLAERQFRNLQVVDPQGRVVASTPQLQGKPVIARFTPDSKNMAISVVCGGVFPPDECDIVVAQWAHRAGERWLVYSSSPAVPPWVDPRLAGLVGGCAVALTAAITYLAHRNVRASLRPVNAIRAELDNINATSSGRRVPVPPTDDEIHEMSASVNHTLCRLDNALHHLQTALEQQRRFYSNASHDLRTPIAAMRAEVEDALLAPQETDVTKLGSAILPSLDRLQTIVQDLLTLERLDSRMSGAYGRIDLAKLVAAELRTRHHMTKEIESALEPDVVVMGDRLELARLFTSLLDNAERHAATTITIAVRHEPSGRCGDQRLPHGAAVLELIDDGPGIDPDKRELVFQRFTRLDAARSRDAGGAGLGLPIARQIAEAAGGTLRIEDSSRGARLVLCLPSASSASDDTDPASLG